MGNGSQAARRSIAVVRARRARGRGSRPIGLATVVLVSFVSILAVASAVSLHIGSSLETLSGETSPAEFLSHWQFIEAAPATTPLPIPRVWSVTAATPTRLARLPTNYLLNAGRLGHTGAKWVFNETVGIAASTELEIVFTLGYDVGTAAHAFTTTAYVETQARALAGTLVFTVYWDSGATTAITILSQVEVTQVCSAVGTCP